MLRLSLLELWCNPLATSILAWSVARHRRLLRLLPEVVGLTRAGRCRSSVAERLLLIPLTLLRLGAIGARLMGILSLRLLLLITLMVLVVFQMLRRLLFILAAQLRADCLSQLVQHRLARGDCLFVHCADTVAGLVRWVLPMGRCPVASCRLWSAIGCRYILWSLLRACRSVLRSLLRARGSILRCPLLLLLLRGLVDR